MEIVIKDMVTGNITENVIFDGINWSKEVHVDRSMNSETIVFFCSHQYFLPHTHYRCRWNLDNLCG